MRRTRLPLVLVSNKKSVQLSIIYLILYLKFEVNVPELTCFSLIYLETKLAVPPATRITLSRHYIYILDDLSFGGLILQNMLSRWIDGYVPLVNLSEKLVNVTQAIRCSLEGINIETLNVCIKTLCK